MALLSCKGESERLREELTEQKKLFKEYVITVWLLLIWLYVGKIAQFKPSNQN